MQTIVWYQRAVEGRPSPCRFTPSCSTYAYAAFDEHGGRRGTGLTLRRLLRCRPFGPSGYDPVPSPHETDPAPMPERPPSLNGPDSCDQGQHFEMDD